MSDTPYTSWPFVTVTPQSTTALSAFLASLATPPPAAVISADDKGVDQLYVNVADQPTLTNAFNAFDFAGAATDAAWVKVRQQRNALLSACDWTQGNNPSGNIGVDDWATYRQALRDVPQNNSDPTNVTWPNPPDLPSLDGVPTNLSTAISAARAAGTLQGGFISADTSSPAQASRAQPAQPAQPAPAKT